MDVTESTFDEHVIGRSHEVPVLVDFWAAWCGPCRSLAPALQQSVREREGRVELAKVDVDSNQQLSMRYGVQGVPAVKLFRDGKVVDEFVGARPKPMIDSFLDAALGPAEPQGPTRLEQLTDELAQQGRYPEIVEALKLGYHEQALAQMLEQVRRADGSTDDDLRVLMLAVFEQLGHTHPVSTRYRKQLAATVM